MTAPRLIRWSTVAAVAGVAVVAGWVSYEHAVAVVAAHGEPGLLGRAYPGTIDGLIYAASMVLLDAARRDVPAPRLARWLLAVGIGATLGVNLLAGTRYGVLGAAAAAWPALALVGAYELLMLLIRGHAASRPAPAAAHVSASPGASETASDPVPAAHTARASASASRRVSGRASGVRPGPVSDEAAEAQFASWLAEGQVPSLRRIQAELHVGRTRARQIREHLDGLVSAPAGEPR